MLNFVIYYIYVAKAIYAHKGRCITISKFNQMWGALAGYAVTTLLLHLFRKSNRSSSGASQDPDKYKGTNGNQIGSPIPVVLGRAMIKNPLISYYGDFSYRPYTEEYGMHTGWNWSNIIPQVLFTIIMIVAVESGVITNWGVGVTTNEGGKNALIIQTIVDLLMQIMTALFSNHLGRTTIQKGFFYYLGWQHIICWSGKNAGIKRLWMNVYDSNVKESTTVGVWDNGNNVAWRADNPTGITAHINSPEMFGGVDEGGGFVGDVRFYLGGYAQPKDSWMVGQMGASTIEADLRGLTPQYPMFITCVIPKAYIGKQATIPEMWFEVVNYPNTLSIENTAYLSNRYMQDVRDVSDALAVIAAIPPLNRTPEQKVEFEYLTAKYDRLVSMPVYHLGKLGDDLNPAEAIYEILTNDHWGCGYDGERIDVVSLLELGITCEKEELGVSMLMNTRQSAREYLERVLYHINGVMYDNPSTGKLSFKLIRGDYDESELRVFDTSNCVSLVFTRVDWSETVSNVSAKFTDAENKYLEGQLLCSDVANIKITGVQTEKEVDGSYFTTAANARTLAQSKLYSSAYPLSSVEIECNRVGYDVVIGEPIVVSWEPYGIANQVFRVTAVDYGCLTSGNIKITAVEDVYGFDKVDYVFSRGLQWTDPPRLPFDADRHTYFELPYERTFSLNTTLVAVASQPSYATIKWNVWRNISGTYTRTAQSTLWTAAGKLAYVYLEDYKKDTSVGIEFSKAGVNDTDWLDNRIKAIAINPSYYNSLSGQNLILVDDEIMSYDDIEQLPNGNYRLKGVIRGLYDTIPAQHNTESICYFIDTTLNVNASRGVYVCTAGMTVTEKLEITTETDTVAQPFVEADVETFTTTRRSEQPSIMANLKYGVDKGTLTTYDYKYIEATVFGGDLKFNFLTRNKFSEFNIHSADEDIGVVPASDTLNVITAVTNRKTIEITDSATDAVTDPTTGVTTYVAKNDMTLSWAEFCKKLGANVAINNIVNFYIQTYDDTRKIYSYSKYSKRVNYSAPRVVGIVTTGGAVQAYADSVVSGLGVGVVIPASIYTPQLTVKYDECPLVIVGVVTTDTTKPLGQDGRNYDFSNLMYRIDGIDSSGKAIIHQVIPTDGYIVRSNFNDVLSNVSLGYQYDGTAWNDYTWY